jgi:zinc/manganese transport system ATP-binding protein
MVANPRDNILEFINLTLGYSRHPAVHHLNSAVAKGELLAIVGPNGGGKSTLLNAIAGELQPLEGKIRYAQDCRQNIAYLPQRTAIDLSFPISVYDIVGSGLWRETGVLSAMSKSHQRRIESALDTVGMSDFKDSTLDVLSGGQTQRVLFARMMVQQAPLVILDEPFTALDSATIGDLIRLLLELNQSGTTVVAVLHDMKMVKDCFPRTLILARELIAHADTNVVFTPANFSKAQHMQESFDELAHICQVELKRTA